MLSWIGAFVRRVSCGLIHLGGRDVVPTGSTGTYSAPRAKALRVAVPTACSTLRCGYQRRAWDQPHLRAAIVCSSARLTSAETFPAGHPPVDHGLDVGPIAVRGDRDLLALRLVSGHGTVMPQHWRRSIGWDRLPGPMCVGARACSVTPKRVGRASARGAGTASNQPAPAFDCSVRSPGQLATPNPSASPSANWDFLTQGLVD
jgi:hypothetical protein